MCYAPWMKEIKLETRKEGKNMSKADEMFEKLGYEKTEHIYPTLGFVVEYDNGERQIDFMNEEEEVKIWNISTTMQELQAINEKVKELGWNE